MGGVLQGRVVAATAASGSAIVLDAVTLTAAVPQFRSRPILASLAPTRSWMGIPTHRERLHAQRPKLLRGVLVLSMPFASTALTQDEKIPTSSPGLAQRRSMPVAA